MSLICCLEPEEGCTCNRDKSCGGIHVISAECIPHARAGEIQSTIHEIGANRIETVASESDDGDRLPYI